MKTMFRDTDVAQHARQAEQPTRTSDTGFAQVPPEVQMSPVAPPAPRPPAFRAATPRLRTRLQRAAATLIGFIALPSLGLLALGATVLTGAKAAAVAAGVLVLLFMVELFNLRARGTRVSCRRELATEEIEVGAPWAQTLHLQPQARGVRWLLSSGLLLFQVRDEHLPPGISSGGIVGLFPNGSLEEVREGYITRPGEHQIGPTSLLFSPLFGGRSRSQLISEAATVLALPRLLRPQAPGCALQLHSRYTGSGRAGTGREAPPVRVGGRPYDPSIHSASQIDFRIARTADEQFVPRYEARTSDGVQIILDCACCASDTTAHDAFLLAQSLAATLLHWCERERIFRVGLWLVDSEQELRQAALGAGLEHTRRLWRMLARAVPTTLPAGREEMEPSVGHLLTSLSRGQIAVVISTRPATAWSGVLARLRRRDLEVRSVVVGRHWQSWYMAHLHVPEWCLDERAIGRVAEAFALGDNALDLTLDDINPLEGIGKGVQPPLPVSPSA